MSTAVKIFIIVNLVLSLALSVVTMQQYATRENWKRRWDQETKEFKKELEASNQALANASKDKVKAEAAFQVSNTQISELQASIKRQEDEKTQQTQEIASQRLALKKKETDFNALNENYMAQSKSLELVRQRNSELTNISQISRAVSFNLNLKLSEVEDDLNNAQGQLAQRSQDIDNVTKSLKRNEAMIALLRQNHPAIYNELADQKASDTYLQGVVAAVRLDGNGNQDLVMLTIGKADKVEEGVEFIVYRANAYVVKVRAERLLNDMVACRVIRDSWNTANLKIEQGDLATNRL